MTLPVDGARRTSTANGRGPVLWLVLAALLGCDAGAASPGADNAMLPGVPGATAGQGASADGSLPPPMMPGASAAGAAGSAAGASDTAGASAAGAGAAAGDPSVAPPPPQDTPAAPAEPPSPGGIKRIYWLDIVGNGVFTARSDGSSPMRIASALAAPDGVVADDCAGKVYFTNMGSALGGSGLASVQRWDGQSAQTLIAPSSGINTAKQLALDVGRGQLYIADREGATIWRSATDGSGLTAMVSGHGFQQLVGVAVDPVGDHVYFTDRNGRRVLRMDRELPVGETADSRTDVETLFEAAAGAMPIDLSLDLDAQQLYLTDRQLGTVQRMGMELPQGQDAGNRTDVEVVLDGLTEPIGVAVDAAGDQLYVTELGGSVHRAHLDGSGDEVIANSGSATGIAVSALDDLGQPFTCE